MWMHSFTGQTFTCQLQKYQQTSLAVMTLAMYVSCGPTTQIGWLHLAKLVFENIHTRLSCSQMHRTGSLRYISLQVVLELHDVGDRKDVANKLLESHGFSVVLEHSWPPQNCIIYAWKPDS